MTRRLTQAEALAFIETQYETAADLIEAYVVEAFIVDVGPDEVRRDMESFVAQMDDEIDFGAMKFENDWCDSGACIATKIIIKTEDQA